VTSLKATVNAGRLELNVPADWPDGTEVEIHPLGQSTSGVSTPVPNDFWQSFSLEELARQQGVSGPRSLEEVLGGWPTDELNDDFEEAFPGWRNGELQQTP
jgi:hypothetical protein